MFFIQDPGNPSTTYLIEILLAECKNATSGGASFAWASSRGINLLLENPQFADFLKKRQFDLVIGVDAVTNPSALKSLVRLQSEFKAFSVSVFRNEYPGSLFHPKVCWFRRDKAHGALITGSGNLTEGGLSKNWEAFTVTKLADDELATIESQWSDWKASYKTDLFDPADPVVIACAERNKRVAAAVRTISTASATPSKGTAAKKALGKSLPGNKAVGVAPAAQAPTAAGGKKAGAPAPAANSFATPDVLIAEIPKGSTRWNQANFDVDNYENYFGAKVGTTRHMFFRHVQQDGSLDATEVRPSVAVKSSNYRFELAAAHGLKYPKGDRPIAVFLRQAARNFLYRLVMPSDPAYKTVRAVLDGSWSGPANRVARVRMSPEELENGWPNTPLLHAIEPEAPAA